MKTTVRLFSLLLVALMLIPAVVACDSGDDTTTTTTTAPVPGAASITLDQTALTLAVGGSVTLTATVLPATADQTVNWSSSTPTIASVVNGTVHGISAGVATITATTPNGRAASCVVTVTLPSTEGSSATNQTSDADQNTPPNDNEDGGVFDDLFPVGDLAYVKNRGKLIVGITGFVPMDYKDENDNWIGFDAELATLFAEYLGVEIAFFEIADWSLKAMELADKRIDCVWNGLPLTIDVKSAMATSVPYCNNPQVVVVSKNKAKDYTTIDSIKDLTFVVEAGSFGEEVIRALGYKSNPVVEVDHKILSEMISGESDACVIDLLMAASMIGEGTDFPDLTHTVKLNDGEQYVVGFRKNSNLVDEINRFFEEKYADGTIARIAEKYRMADALVPIA